jgi:hypothetical protein
LSAVRGPYDSITTGVPPSSELMAETQSDRSYISPGTARESAAVSWA